MVTPLNNSLRMGKDIQYQRGHFQDARSLLPTRGESKQEPRKLLMVYHDQVFLPTYFC